MRRGDGAERKIDDNKLNIALYSHGDGVLFHYVGIPQGRLLHTNHSKGITTQHSQDDSRQLHKTHKLEQEFYHWRWWIVVPRNLASKFGKVLFQEFPNLDKVSL
jgi:hypothetical protein